MGFGNIEVVNTIGIKIRIVPNRGLRIDVQIELQTLLE
jgi:hypothetical protein